MTKLDAFLIILFGLVILGCLVSRKSHRKHARRITEAEWDYRYKCIQNDLFYLPVNEKSYYRIQNEFVMLYKINYKKTEKLDVIEKTLRDNYHDIMEVVLSE
jgi:hypothetical protein